MTAAPPPPGTRAPLGSPGHQPPVAAAPAAGTRSNRLGSTALGLGIAAMVLLCAGAATIRVVPRAVELGAGAGVVALALLAVVLGGVGMSRSRTGRATNRGVALAGLVTGIAAVVMLGLAVGLLFFVWVLWEGFSNL